MVINFVDSLSLCLIKSFNSRKITDSWPVMMGMKQEKKVSILLSFQVSCFTQTLLRRLSKATLIIKVKRLEILSNS